MALDADEDEGAASCGLSAEELKSLKRVIKAYEYVYNNDFVGAQELLTKFNQLLSGNFNLNDQIKAPTDWRPISVELFIKYYEGKQDFFGASFWRDLLRNSNRKQMALERENARLRRELQQLKKYQEEKPVQPEKNSASLALSSCVLMPRQQSFMSTEHPREDNLPLTDLHENSP